MEFLIEQTASTKGIHFQSNFSLVYYWNYITGNHPSTIRKRIKFISNQYIYVNLLGNDSSIGTTNWRSFRYHRQKKVYLISLIFNFSAASFLLFARSLQITILGFFLLGVGRAFSSGSLDAWFVDEFYLINPKGNLQKALSRVGIFIPIGLAAGSLLGGLLPMNLGRITHQLLGLGL